MPSIAKVADRQKLKPSREPYWHRLSTGCYVGVRVMTTGSKGSWLARWRNPETRKQHMKALGTFEDLPGNKRFDAASKAAQEWFSHVGHGGSVEVVTVREACMRYVAHLLREKGESASLDARARFERYVFKDVRLAGLALSGLRAKHLQDWRNALQDAPSASGGPRAASTINRDMTALRAALNLAHDEGLVATDVAWRAKLIPIKGADGRRQIYLDREQRRRLISAAQPDLAVFIRAMCMLPLRPGALAALNVGNYDKRLKTLTVGKDKAGADRSIQLPGSAAALFGDAIRDKLPSAPLLARGDGERWNKDGWKHPFKLAAKEAALPAQACMYVLRHSTITDLVAAGLPLLTVAQMSGTSVQMIEKHYGHLRAETALAALESLAL